MRYPDPGRGSHGEVGGIVGPYQGVLVVQFDDGERPRFKGSSQPMVDIDLTATLSDPDGRITNIEWQWEFQDGGSGPWALISGADSARFRPRASNEGDRLRVEVRYDDRRGAKS